jgi:hypothetical protein
MTAVNQLPCLGLGVSFDEYGNTSLLGRLMIHAEADTSERDRL